MTELGKEKKIITLLSWKIDNNSITEESLIKKRYSYTDNKHKVDKNVVSYNRLHLRPFKINLFDKLGATQL